jgi:aryl-alcohol dehydrogenase-like predicted oxidoreductase
MGMTAFYGDFDRDASESESLHTIAVALQQGINFLDTAWVYQVLVSHAYALTSRISIVFIGFFYSRLL